MMKRLVFTFFLILLASSAHAGLPLRSAVAGNWYIGGNNVACPASLDGTAVHFTGCLFRAAWQKIQTGCSPSTYNWTPLDTSISHAKAAGYSLAISIYMGPQLPDCELNKPALASSLFSYIWDRDTTPALSSSQNGVPTEACTTVDLVDPRNSTYQTDLETFYADIANRALVTDNAGSTLVRVVVTPIAGHDDELEIPHYDANTAPSTTITCTQATGCGCGAQNCTCNPNNDTLNWANFATPYTVPSMATAINNVLVAVAADFPNQFVEYMTDPGFPPADKNGNPCQYGVANGTNLCNTGTGQGGSDASKYTEGVFLLKGKQSVTNYGAQNNSWNSTNYDPQVAGLNTYVGEQAAAGISNDATLCAALGLLYTYNIWWDETYSGTYNDANAAPCYSFFQNASQGPRTPGGTGSMLP